jgi:hypothetical protein
MRSAAGLDDFGATYRVKNRRQKGKADEKTANAEGKEHARDEDDARLGPQPRSRG